ncbi:IS3 family transposase [Streptomyces sp. NBC_01462]|uniref:IS3 family transposase n=1 Tax=Streptomyces sp. NBC_01462 TaxID=2903876 RepID=UPI002E3774BF|nr:IS3 family transposase [Streptomyces sp. NBC_01462]
MRIPDEIRTQLELKFAVLFPHLDERQRRLLMAAEARVLGHGGVRAVARAAAVSETTVRKGVFELETGEEPLGRVRRPGGGRKRVAELAPGLRPALLALVEPDERGDPMSPLRWTVKSTRNLARELAPAGNKVSADTVRALMRELGLVPCQPRPWRATTIADDAAPATADLLARDFTADAPGRKLVSGITYVHTWAGFLYLATVIDCHTKTVVGWAMADHMKTSLISDALDMAARNIDLAEGCIFHSDRGGQYTSRELRCKLSSLGLRASVGHTGVCWDNAMAESFFGSLKNELVQRTSFPTRAHAHRAIVRYIEMFYNRKRLHSRLGYNTPAEVHAEYEELQAAA